MYPLVEVPDLLREVHEWTGFADHFTHVRNGDVPKNLSAMLAGVWPMLRTLGPKRMAGASKGLALTRLGGCAHSTPDRRHTARLKRASPMPTPSIRIRAFGAMAQRHRPMANSSVRATGLAKRGDVNLHYGSEPGSKFYSHLSDQYGYFSIFAHQSHRERGGLCARWAIRSGHCPRHP